MLCSSRLVNLRESVGFNFVFDNPRFEIPPSRPHPRSEQHLATRRHQPAKNELSVAVELVIAAVSQLPICPIGESDVSTRFLVHSILIPLWHSAAGHFRVPS